VSHHEEENEGNDYETNAEENEYVEENEDYGVKKAGTVLT